MNSRDKILSAVAANQPVISALPDLDILKGGDIDLVEKFIETLIGIGGKVIKIARLDEVEAYVKSNITAGQRMLNMVPGLSNAPSSAIAVEAIPHGLENVELAIIQAEIGVAENGAVWLNEGRLGQRVVPFICQHLVVILDKSNIVPTMHEAYDKIGLENYSFATFIAGPSKTADIEQSLVLGAHGSRSMTVFLSGL